MRLKLERVYFNAATLGEISLPDGTKYKTLELPDNQNMRNISCIPEGVYDVVKGRNSLGSPVLQVLDVSDRSGIQIHVANYLKQIQGCIAVGMQHSEKLPYSVTESRLAFDSLWSKVPDSFTLEIKKKERFLIRFGS